MRKAKATKRKQSMHFSRVSWPSLNWQVRWMLDDIIEAALRRNRFRCGERSDLAMVKQFMEDGSDFYWQKFIVLSERAQVRLILAAAREREGR